MTSAEDSEAFVPGPLDELVPGLRARADRLKPMAVHPKVVRALREDGTYSLVFASFAPPASARALHAALKPLVEAALLVELCRPARELREGTSKLSTLELLCFAQASFDMRPALSPFGFVESDLKARDAQKPLALMRREVQLLDGTIGDEPIARFSAPVSHASKVDAQALHTQLLARINSVFGEEPGVLARMLGEALGAHAVVEPTRPGIEAVEALLVQDLPYAVRFMPPLAFQGLCDLVAVAAHSTWGREVEWGVCEPDPESGLAPPPVLRVTRDDETFHVPLGEHVLRWCVMPLSPGESVPTLGAWAEHEFT
jgi:hypothetical protein